MAAEGAFQSVQFEYAGFWQRFIANFIDGVLLAIIIWPILIAVYGWDYFTSTDVVAGPIDFLLTWVLPAFAIILLWMYKQATPGKMAISARIVDAKTGAKPSTGQLIGRYFAYIPSTLVFCLGFLWIAFDPKKQGWHDKLAGTVVVRPAKHAPEPVRFATGS
ncbi:MAG: RDD family protein [Candidatus Latescibacteria bacterium]|nr:RDD family protein [Candidatus Latescibacterota bacterium]